MTNIKIFSASNGSFLEDIVIRFLSFFLIILGIAIAFAVFEKYYLFLKFLLFPLIFLLIAYLISFIFINRRKIEFSKNKIDYLIAMLILAFCIFNAFFFYEFKVEGGHDQGGYYQNAILLSKTGHYYVNATQEPIALTIPGYSIYENGMVRWHFIPGGPVYYSIFYHLFGVSGFPAALSFSLFFSCLVIYFLCKKIRNWKAGAFFLLFFLFNYYTIFFSRATWVENIQLLLTWFYVFLFVKGYILKSRNYMLLAFLPVSILMLFRLEAMLYVAVYFAALFYFLVAKRKEFGKEFSYFSAAAILLFGALMVLSPFIFDIYGMVFDKDSPVGMIINTLKNPVEAGIVDSATKAPYNEQIFIWVFLYQLFGAPFLIISFLAVYNLFKENQQIKKIAILIAFLILPQFIFLIRPSVQLYLQWAARRFFGAFIPFIFILFSLFMTNPRNKIVSSKRISAVFLVLMFFLACLPGIKIIALAQGKGLLNYYKELASNFNETDAVIFWGRYGYENFGPPLYFLHGTNVVFDRSPEFDKEIYAMVMKNYDNVYIATSLKPDKSQVHPYFNGNITFIKTIESPAFKIIAPSRCDVRMYNYEPEKFYGYKAISDLCSGNNPPVGVSDYKISLNIYKIEPSFKEKFVKENYNSSYKVTRETKEIWH
jgi:hypothetical protein